MTIHNIKASHIAAPVLSTLYDDVRRGATRPLSGKRAHTLAEAAARSVAHAGPKAGEVVSFIRKAVGHNLEGRMMTGPARDKVAQTLEASLENGWYENRIRQVVKGFERFWGGRENTTAEMVEGALFAHIALERDYGIPRRSAQLWDVDHVHGVFSFKDLGNTKVYDMAIDERVHPPRFAVTVRDASQKA